MNKTHKFLMVTSILLSSAYAVTAFADTAKARCDIYPKGSDKASESLACTFSQRQGFIRIDLLNGVEYSLNPTNDTPGKYVDQDGKSAYRQKGLEEEGLIFRLDKQSIFVYWDPTPFWQEDATSGFSQSYEFKDISFKVSSANNASVNTLVIQPGGLKSDNEAISVEIDGTITAAKVVDLDVNGWPEIYVFVTSAGSGSYGSVVAYAVNDGKSLSPIHMADLSDDPVNSIGYMGHDEFNIVELVLARRFPIYHGDDSNSSPNGGTRQLQYKLVEGEAGWVLELDLAMEF